MKRKIFQSAEGVEALCAKLLIDRGRRLKEERKRLGYSLLGFAKLIGVHRNTQSNYEAGREPPPSYLLAAQGVGVDVEYVIAGDWLLKNHGLSTVLHLLTTELGIEHEEVLELLQTAEMAFQEVRCEGVTEEAEILSEKVRSGAAKLVQDAVKLRLLGADAES
jgi:transcriptional regulator with XRE-family HTH domain